MAATRRIDQLQNDSRSMTLLRSIAVTHRRSQRAQAASLTMSLAIAGLGVLAQITHLAIPAVSIIGASWAAMYGLAVAPASRRYLQISATLQEMFDTALFGLPWNAVLVGEPLSEDELSHLSRRFRGDHDLLRDYYLVASVVSPYDVLFCLEQNLAWGSRVRRRFADLLTAIAALWCAAGIAVAFVTQTTVGTLVTAWLVPSLGLLLLCSDLSRTQISSIRDRARVLRIVRTVTDDPLSSHLASEAAFTLFARQVQDVLFIARRQQPRTPRWFFRLFHDDDMTDFQYKMRILEQRVGAHLP